MRRFALVGLLLLSISSCASRPYWTPGSAMPMAAQYQNPSLIPTADHQAVWESVVDVVDDYFRIEREEPVRVCADIITEGRLDTFPEVGSTLLEPWRHDSANAYEKLESTLQSIRRRAAVRVMPAEHGYKVSVAVFKELENLAPPERATAGGATFRYDGSLNRVVDPIHQQPVEEGWIPMGRDLALEQRMLGQIMAKFGAPQRFLSGGP